MFVTPVYILHNLAEYEHAVNFIFKKRKRKAKRWKTLLRMTQGDTK